MYAPRRNRTELRVSRFAIVLEARGRNACHPRANPAFVLPSDDRTVMDGDHSALVAPRERDLSCCGVRS
jgi:hypothetical protein